MQSSAPAHRDDDKVTIPDEEDMNRKLKAFNGNLTTTTTTKTTVAKTELRIGLTWFQELAGELNKEERLGQPVQQTLADILKTAWQNP